MQKLNVEPEPKIFLTNWSNTQSIINLKLFLLSIFWYPFQVFFGWAQMSQLKLMKVNVWLCSVQNMQQSEAQHTAWRILMPSPAKETHPRSYNTFKGLFWIIPQCTTTCNGFPCYSRCSGCWALAQEWRLQVRSDSDHVKPSVYVSPPDASSFLGAVALSFVYYRAKTQTK